jgi:hypothetical protein
MGHDAVRMATCNPVFLRYGWGSETSPMRLVLCSNGGDLFCGEFGIPAYNAAPLRAILHVVSVGPLYDMARVEARRIVAGMAAFWRWPMSVSQIERKAMNQSIPSFKLDCSISVRDFTERPEQTGIAVVVGDGVGEPKMPGVKFLLSVYFLEGGDLLGRLWFHLRSFVARVFGRVRCINSGSPFIVSLSVLRNQDYSDCLVTEDGIGFTVGKL